MWSDATPRASKPAVWPQRQGTVPSHLSDNDLLQRIEELIDGPDIHSGDLQAFRLFALRVCSLEGMLEYMGTRGHVELECGSHVSRLLSKLPYDLTASFKRVIHPMRVAIPTHVNFAEWLEYELDVQEDSVFAKRERSNPVGRKRTKGTPSQPANPPPSSSVQIKQLSQAPLYPHLPQSLKPTAPIRCVAAWG